MKKLEKRTKVYLLDRTKIADPVNFSSWKDFLPKERWEKTVRPVREEDRKTELAAWLLLYHALKEWEIPEESIRADGAYCYGEHGKPERKKKEVCFNLSHSGKYVMCVVSDVEVGCDIEKIQKVRWKLAKRFFSEGEYDILEKYRQKVSFITVDPLNELDDQYSVTLEKSDSQKMLDLLKQDIAEASPQELIGIPCGQMELYATSYADMDEHIAPESYAEVGRYIFPTFKRTLVFLKEKGYAFVMEKENLKQYDYSVTYNTEEMDVTDPEQKEELAQSLIRELECPAWLETEAGVSVKVALNSTESAGESLNGIEFAVLKAKEPEFIKKIVETGEEEE